MTCSSTRFGPEGRAVCSILTAAICLVLCFMQGGAVFAGPPENRPGRELAGTADYIPDGDTIILHDGTSVRLLGIDTPETSHHQSEAGYYSDRARDTLKFLAGRHTLRIVPGPKPHDKYGRILALVHLPSGVMLNEELLRRGCAFYYPFPGESFSFGPRFLELQRAAMKRRTGAWGRVLSMPEAKLPYVGNRRSLRFFPAGSRYAAKISARNRVMFKDLEAAFSAGYAPVRVTTPWPKIGIP